MGADTKALRTRIKSVDSTLHLTKAMGLVASSKIRHASEVMNKSRQYSKAVSEIVELLTACNECRKSPYIKGNDSGKTRIIIIAGDRGLAGGYNANVFRLAKEYAGAEFIPIGKRACERFGNNGYLSVRALFAGRRCKAFCRIVQRFCRRKIFKAWHNFYKIRFHYDARSENFVDFTAHSGRRKKECRNDIRA